MSVELMIQPATEPLTLAEAKAFLRLGGDAEDELVTALILAARLAVEQLSRRRLIAQTLRARFDRLPRTRTLRLAAGPVIEVAALEVAGPDGELVPIVPSAYAVDLVGEVARIDVKVPLSPGLRFGGIAVTYVAGFGATAGDVPEPLRQAMRLLVAHWFENRGDARAAGLPEAVVGLVAPFRRTGLAA
ncbi:head-tail connector protein [Methylobrevis pamukkalensis]|uniref:Phage gp6-like head-tail connector protein n=1 Tax=Methylobrevis pamukkalensis TaxID=1439726 RepID=A0A1E3H7V8_9HYPH|nr:phage head-tail connector protein [Methylobrevis pamukkalensis]ODN72429.1 Phage gp6-like head-tail connector protein [Methylobrevis pamukkalensis]